MSLDAPQPLLPDLIAQNAKWLGMKPALIFEGQITTWRDLARGINRVANGLRYLGIGPGDVVGVVMDNAPEMVEIIWGIIVSGAAVAPLNTSVADDALVAMLADAQVSAIFADHPHAQRIDERLRAFPVSTLAGGRVAIGAALEGWTSYAVWRDRYSDVAPAVRYDPDSPCNIIYSSGTTSRPKGIVHTHLGRLAWTYDAAIALRYGRSSVTLVAIGLYSNISWVGMLCTVLAGGTIVLMRRFDPEEALRLIDRHGVTNTALVPLLFQRLIDVPAIDRFDLGSVRALMSAGSPLWEDLRKALFERFGKTIIELYGLTEGLITTLEPEEAEGRLTSVGKPVPGSDIRIVHDDGSDCPCGEVGEIVGRSRFIMAGYHNRPEATAAAMVADQDGRMWLRTGDLGRLDSEGYLYLVGRKKDMILSGGQNIYPADIEVVALKHPDIVDVAVIGIPHETWGETPLALVVTRTTRLNPDELRTWINDRVGKFQRVHRVEVRPTLPRNPNGKLLKQELRAPYWPDNGRHNP